MTLINNGQYGRGNGNDATIKFETKVIKTNLCDYSDAYILMTGDIKVADVAAYTNVAFKNCAPFTRCVAHKNDEHVETAENLDIIMPMHNLIEYSDKYADSSGSLYQFKRDESPMSDAENPLNVALGNSTSFKYKASRLGKATDADSNDRSLKNTEIVVPLKYLSNIFNNTLSLSRHEQVCLMRLHFERYPDDGRSISRNVASLNILVHDVINLVYYEH